MKENKLINISLIKTLMMVIVVLCHSCSFYTGNWFTVVKPVYASEFFSSLSTILGTFHVQTFCMASGFLYFYLKNTKRKYSNIKSSIISKFKRLVIPYIFTCIFWVIPITVYFFHYSPREILTKYILMTSPSQLWFLIMLFGVFVLFFTILNKIKINTRNLIIIYFISIILSSVLSKIGINYFQISNVVCYTLYFYLGGYIFCNKDKIIDKRTIIITIISIIILSFIYFFLAKYEIKFVDYALHFVSPLLSISEIIFIYYLCTILSNYFKLNNKIYKLIEENSFGIYLFHQQIIYFTIIFLNGIVPAFVQVVLCFTISLILSLLISMLLKHNKITKFMFGL